MEAHTPHMDVHAILPDVDTCVAGIHTYLSENHTHQLAGHANRMDTVSNGQDVGSSKLADVSCQRDTYIVLMDIVPGLIDTIIIIDSPDFRSYVMGKMRLKWMELDA